MRIQGHALISILNLLWFDLQSKQIVISMKRRAIFISIQRTNANDRGRLTKHLNRNIFNESRP